MKVVAQNPSQVLVALERITNWPRFALHRGKEEDLGIERQPKRRTPLRSQILIGIGRRIVALLVGGGDVVVKVKVIEEIGLGSEAGNVPDRHANICGWPDDKDGQRSLAQQVAGAATLSLRRDGTRS